MIAEKLTTIAENQQRVYQAGYNKGEGDAGVGAYQVGYETGHYEGFQEGKAEGFADGKPWFFNQVESLAYFCIENANWNILPWVLEQDLSHINRTQAMFTYATKLTEFHRPETMKPKNLRDMFNYAGKLVRVSGFEGLPDDCILGNFFSNCTSLEDAGTINFTKASFNQSIFANCTALEEIRFAGELSRSLDIHWSTKLSRASIESIIGALSDTTSGLTLTLSKAAVETAFGSTTAEAWTTLANTKQNWTISLV